MFLTMFKSNKLRHNVYFKISMNLIFNPQIIAVEMHFRLQMLQLTSCTAPWFTIYEGHYSRNYGAASLLFEDPRTEIRTQSIFIMYRKEENI